MSAGARVGIDLGTTNSLVAIVDGGVPVVLSNALGERLMPSAVSVQDDGILLVGAAARARALTHPERTRLAFKRDMGTSKTYELGQVRLTPVECSALVLKELIREAEAVLQRPIIEAVVTVPAYFGEEQRRDTQAACEIAGLHVERIINEPTAAALAYGLQHRDREFNAVVIDLGGGTFDVTVLESMEGVIAIQSTAGDSKLGGEDFVDALVEHVLKRLLADDIRPRTLVEAARLREALERVKCELSSSPRATLLLADFGGRSRVELEVTREDAESQWFALLARIRAPILRALSDAALEPKDIEELLLVGGASRMPCLRKLAEDVFGRVPVCSLPPDEAVAIGAAVQMALKARDESVGDLVVTDVAPFTLGIELHEKAGSEVVGGLFSPVLERSTVLPASRSTRVSTLADYQRAVEVVVYQGEHSLCRDNSKLGSLRVKGIPSAKAGQQAIDIRFTYDLNGVLEVECTVEATGEKSYLVLERSGRLTKQQIEAARARMRALKFHPRDALPNVTALAQADALFVELRGTERRYLEHAIQAFRGILETQDAPAIAERRAQLNEVVASLRR